jgi:fluoroquinolone transport system ATP-binding protein
MGADGPMIRVDSLRYAYPGAGADAVCDLCFEVHAGEVFGFLGPSGAGKSTTQNVLIGLLRGWRGGVEVLGRPLEDWDSGYYHEIGVSSELPNHYPTLTVGENLDLFRALHEGRGEDVGSALRLVGLEDVVDVRVARLSKGMQHRLTFARSLLHGPRLWFLDEPTAGLDPVNARRILEIIEARRRQGVTTFLTTHDMHVADRLCDRVAFIVDGRVEVIDAPRTLRHRFGRRDVVVTWEEDGVASATFPLDGLADDAAFHAVLREHRVDGIHSQETTLEEVFIRVTGRSLQ